MLPRIHWYGEERGMERKGVDGGRRVVCLWTNEPSHAHVYMCVCLCVCVCAVLLQVAGSASGISAFQMDIKVEGITLDIMKQV